ncbi:MAG: cohesin domain-containing protein [Acidobacteria bacterium]|nr:cohesin domain-containing protein [Acidobacteriota bacterium]MCL5288727.1 cohesin domain-containing protein [Acidobacteriota bacterium]
MKRSSVFLLCLLLAACKGGGGGAPPPPPTSTAIFTPATAPPGAAITVTGPAGAQQGSITLDLNAQSLPANTYGIAFDLDFNSGLVAFAGPQNGTFFEAAGPASYQVKLDPANNGKLIVGVMLLGQSSGVSGSGRIVSLRFNILNNAGSAPLTFSGNAAQNSSGQPLSGLSWAAGTVQVTR